MFIVHERQDVQVSSFNIAAMGALPDNLHRAVIPFSAIDIPKHNNATPLTAIPWRLHTHEAEPFVAKIDTCFATASPAFPMMSSTTGTDIDDEDGELPPAADALPP